MIALVITAGVLIWWTAPNSTPPAPTTSETPAGIPTSLPQTSSASQPVQPPATVSTSPISPVMAPSVTVRNTPPPVDPVPGPEAAQPEAYAKLDELHLMLRDFRGAFGENPEGTNAEITAALRGANKKQLQMFRPGFEVNDKGEMVDQWGTPYFFHQQSAKEMEIRSAGPDQRLWNEDDITIR